jgi:carboxyl-terminal processing protease
LTRNGDETAVTEAEVETGHTDFPLVVLVNGDTSGGGELIAAALQDHGRAVVAGQRTVGKASVQSELDQSIINVPMMIPKFKLTRATFVRPSGKNLQRFPDSKPSDDWGIRPDPGRELPLSVELGRQLKEWYQWQVLRPYDSREALPLDDPENDPQREGAFQVLRALVR